MSNIHSQKFYCYSCNKETLGIISNIQTSRGINQCIICTNCFNMVSLSLLDKINKKVDELIKEDAKAKIDPTTEFVIGSIEYNDYYYPKFEKGMHR